jgi:predicted nucleic acid-binding protein
MKFWDTSALVPLVIDEPVTPEMRALLRRDRDVIVWMLTGVELLSTLGRLGRLSAGLADLLPGVRLAAMDLFQKWASVTHVEGVRRRAERLVGVHPLSAADAMQLGAALMAAGDRPETLDVVTLDRNLARAAQLEGFRVLPG